jgi:hypothetical protein
LAAVRAGKRVGFPGLFFVEKIALVHQYYINHRGRGEHREMRAWRLTGLMAWRQVQVTSVF